MRLVFASFLLSGCVLLRAGDCGGSAQGGGGSGGAVNSGGLGGGGGSAGTGGQSQTAVCSPACKNAALCECANYSAPPGKPICDVEVVELDNVTGLGAIAVSGDQLAWLALSGTSVGIGRRSAALTTEEWQSEFSDYYAVGDSPLDSAFGTIEGGGFFFRSPSVKKSLLCWPDAPCKELATQLEIRHLRVQSERLAVAAGTTFCNLELGSNELQSQLKSTLETLSSETTGCQPVSPNAPTSAERVDFADASASRVWLTTSSAVLVTDLDGALLSNMPIGFEVRATAGALACDANPRALLFKQCPPQEMCTLRVVGAPIAASQLPSPSPVEAGPIPAESVIAADRDYFYFSSPGNINAVVRSAEKAVQIPLPPNSSAVLSMDASHEDYLYFTYWEKEAVPAPKFYLGRWHKQKLTPAATP